MTTRVRTPMVPAGAAPRGSVYVLEERCKGCGLCIAFCPRQVLVESPDYNAQGYHPPAVIRPDACANCQICFLICPEFAIYSAPRESGAGNGQPDLLLAGLQADAR